MTQIASYVNSTSDSKNEELPHADLIEFIDPSSENFPIAQSEIINIHDERKTPQYQTFSDPIYVLFGFFDIDLVRRLTVLIMNLLDNNKLQSSSCCVKRVTRLSHSSNSLLQFWLNENRMPSGWLTSHSAKVYQAESARIATAIDTSFDSDIFTLEMVDQLQEFLPPDCAIRNWKRCFSTSTDGVSSLTLYRNLEGMGPCIIAIQDTSGAVFGCFIDQLISSNHYYGTPQIFIYKFNPIGSTDVVNVYYPSSHGRCFVFSNETRIAIGGDDYGKSALTIDKDFYRGSSDYCGIFKNPPLVDSGEFLIKHFEVWAFIDI